MVLNLEPLLPVMSYAAVSGMFLFVFWIIGGFKDGS